MPSTRLDTRSGWINGRYAELLEAIQRGLVDGIRIPDTDRCVRIYEYPDGAFLVPLPARPGLPRTPRNLDVQGALARREGAALWGPAARGLSPFGLAEGDLKIIIPRRSILKTGGLGGKPADPADALTFEVDVESIMPLRYWVLIKSSLGAVWELFVSCSTPSSFARSARSGVAAEPHHDRRGDLLGLLPRHAPPIAARSQPLSAVSRVGILNYAIPFALFPMPKSPSPARSLASINGLTPMTTVIVSQLWRRRRESDLEQSRGRAPRYFAGAPS